MIALRLRVLLLKLSFQIVSDIECDVHHVESLLSAVEHPRMSSTLVTHAHRQLR